MSNTENQPSTGSITNQKILFLDIDGVLNSEEFYKNSFNSGEHLNRFDPSSVSFIKALVEEFSLKIVISSTWRFGAVDRLMHELKRNKLLNYLYPDWFTPVIHPVHRGTEIKFWLDLHPEITDYAIIDDDENILEEQKNNYVKTCLHKGMTIEHYNRVRAIFSTVMSMQE
jgi:hypothetical protein